MRGAHSCREADGVAAIEPIGVAAVVEPIGVAAVVEPIGVAAVVEPIGVAVHSGGVAVGRRGLLGCAQDRHRDGVGATGVPRRRV
ncbi:hypothetical protein ACLQ29_22860 [Micromonospora sp. DT228]|uniref:hypothetical protein n=1 Tax=Micromonospora sp. DT228 TaxID=3393443 RepID=UPI003CED5E9D